MSFLTPDQPKKVEEPAAEIAAGARLVPRITIQAFCEQSQTAQLIDSAMHDRRMSKVALTTHNGGIDGAVETYKANPTPNLIIVETLLAPDAILRRPVATGRGLRRLDAGHRAWPRQRRAAVPRTDPLGHFRVYRAAGIGIADRYRDHRTVRFRGRGADRPNGRLCVRQGWRGRFDRRPQRGLGHCDLAASGLPDRSIIDLPFGTAGLNFNQDPPHGWPMPSLANQKVDQTMLDRLMSKAANHINLSDCTRDAGPHLGLRGTRVRADRRALPETMPVVVLDIPHAWNAWTRHTLATIDEVVIVAEPDLANLRNAKNLADTIKALRPTEKAPKPRHQQARSCRGGPRSARANSPARSNAS
jgi:pilus assembly protein CpaE